MTEDPASEPQTISEVLTALNTELLDTASQTAAQAFNVGCVISGLVVMLTTGLAVVFSHWVTGMVALIITSMLAISVANLLSSRSYQGNLKLTFEEHIRPQLPAIRQRFGLSFAELQAVARQELPADAPLARLLENLRAE